MDSSTVPGADQDAFLKLAKSDLYNVSDPLYTALKSRFLGFGLRS